MAEDPSYIPAERSTESELAIPIRSGSGSILGVINIESCRVSAFSGHQVKWLEAFAATLGDALIETGQRDPSQRFPEDLHNEARNALKELGIVSADQRTLSIIVESARFAPEPNMDRKISLSRMFCGAFYVGKKIYEPEQNDLYLLSFVKVLESQKWRDTLRRNLSRFSYDGFAETSRRLTLGFSASSIKALFKAQRSSGGG